MTYSKWLTTQHVTVYASCHHKLCASIQLYNCMYWEDSAQLPLWDIMVCGRWSIVFPGGTVGVDWLPTREERKHILGRTVCLDGEVASDTTWDVMQICSVKLAHGVSKSANISMPGACDISMPEACDIFKVPGACDIWSARGMNSNDCRNVTLVIGSSQVWLALRFYYYYYCNPHSWSE